MLSTFVSLSSVTSMFMLLNIATVHSCDISTCEYTTVYLSISVLLGIWGGSSFCLLWRTERSAMSILLGACVRACRPPGARDMCVFSLSRSCQPVSQSHRTKLQFHQQRLSTHYLTSLPTLAPVRAGLFNSCLSGRCVVLRNWVLIFHFPDYYDDWAPFHTVMKSSAIVRYPLKSLAQFSLKLLGFFLLNWNSFCVLYMSPRSDICVTVISLCSFTFSSWCFWWIRILDFNVHQFSTFSFGFSASVSCIQTLAYS